MGALAKGERRVLEDLTHDRPVRVCVTGAECTGKTALAQALADRLGVPVVEQAVDDYFTRKAESGDVNVFAADIVHAVEIQQETEATAPDDRTMIVMDTDLFTIAVWCQRYLGRRFSGLDELVRERQASDRRVDLYVLAAPDIPFEHTAIRGPEEERQVMHGAFQQALATSGYPYIEVFGSVEERCAQVTAALSLLAASTALELAPAENPA